MSKYQELPGNLHSIADAERGQGRVEIAGILDYAARAIESLEEEVGKRDACIEIQDGELRRLRSKIAPLQEYSDRRVAEEREATETIANAIEPFAWIGQWLFTRDLPDDVPMVTIEGVGKPIDLTRGMFKAAHSALSAIRALGIGDSPTPPVQEITPAAPQSSALKAFKALRSDVEQFDDHEPDGNSGLFSDRVPLFMKSYLVNWLRRFMDDHGDDVQTAIRSALSQPVQKITSAGWKAIPTEILDRFPEINPGNYSHDDVCELNAWGVEVYLAAAPTPTPASENNGV